jgi:hypothetical protein
MSVFTAVHARPWEITDLCVGKFFAICDFKQLHPGDTALFVRFICSNGDVVFLGAGDHTGPAPGTFVQVDDHAIPVSLGMFFFHDLPHI